MFVFVISCMYPCSNRSYMYVQSARSDGGSDLIPVENNKLIQMILFCLKISVGEYVTTNKQSHRNTAGVCSC
mgnify:CR=1 FL=1